MPWRSEHPLSSNNLAIIDMFLKLLFVISYKLFYLIHVYNKRKEKADGSICLCVKFLRVKMFPFHFNSNENKYPSGTFNYTHLECKG